MKKRLLELDLIRVVAITLVIFQHCWSILDLDVPAQVFSYHGYRGLIYGVPLFVMLSGFFQIGKDQAVGPYLKDRFARILPPFFVWMVVAYILSAFTHKYEEVSSLGDGLKQFVPFLITNRINEAFWYIFMLSGLYLVTPVLQRAFAAKDRKPLLEYCLVLWLAVTLLWDFLPQFELVRQFPIAGIYLGFYLAGFYICTYMDDRKLNLRLGLVLFVATYALNVFLMYRGHAYQILEVIEVLGLFLLLKSARLEGERNSSALITRISRYSFTIYLTHFILIRALYTFLPDLFPLHWASPIYTTFLVLIAEYVFCRVLEAIPFIPNRLVGIS